MGTGFVEQPPAGKAQRNVVYIKHEQQCSLALYKKKGLLEYDIRFFGEKVMKAGDFLRNRLYYAKVFCLQHRALVFGAAIAAACLFFAFYPFGKHPPVTEEEFAQAMRSGADLYARERFEEA